MGLPFIIGFIVYIVIMAGLTRWFWKLHLQRNERLEMDENGGTGEHEAPSKHGDRRPAD